MDNSGKATWDALQEDLKASALGVKPGVNVVNTEEADIRHQNAMLVEALNNVQQMLAFEDRNWSKLFGSPALNEGMTLDLLKETSATIREYIYGSPIIKRASQLRATYVWSKGIVIPDSKPTGDRGAPTALMKFFANRTNQESMFMASAHEAMERAADSDGIFLLVGDNRNKTVRPIPLTEITSLYVNPDYPGEVWAYLREWNTGTGVVNKGWYYTDRHPKARRTTIKDANGIATPVVKDHTLFDQPFNRQVGWSLGAPGLTSAVAWARIYAEFLKYGKAQAEALAKLTFQVQTDNPTNTASVAAKVAGFTGAGNTYVGSNKLEAVSTAGKGYDFGSGRALAAQVATAAEVSVIHLLSDPGAAGSSYGSAATLDVPTIRSVVARQEIWKDFFKRVLRWATGVEVDVSFLAVNDQDEYRATQSAMLRWQSGLLHPDEARQDILDSGGVVSKHDAAPDGVLIPQNKDSLALKSIDTDGSTSQAASPDQGRGNGTGGQSSNDLRSDLIANALNDERMDRFQSLIERAEKALND